MVSTNDLMVGGILGISAIMTIFEYTSIALPPFVDTVVEYPVDFIVAGIALAGWML